MQYEEPKKDALVFVGMNPSFSKKGWKALLRVSDTSDLDPESFLQWPSPQDFKIELSHKLEALAKKKYPFFAPHRALSSILNLEWAHFDLFAYRETSQFNTRTLVLKEGEEIELTDFGLQQIVLFENLLQLAQPKVVIVVNALASQIYLKRRSPKFDSSKGYYIDSFDNSKDFPVFFFRYADRGKGAGSIFKGSSVLAGFECSWKRMETRRSSIIPENARWRR